jgi:carbonic anhydrase
MTDLKDIFESNRAWAARTAESDPDFFPRLSAQQKPNLLWIGCADSRVPATEICGLPPGAIFVHRNIANVVVHTDMNCLSVMQYAVEILKVEDIIVCGHYGCGGVGAALHHKPLGLIDNWLRNIKDVYENRQAAFLAMDADRRSDRLCELNVVAQVANACHTTIVQDAWRRGQDLTVHGFIYSLKDGLLRDLDVSICSPDQLSDIYRME